MREVIKVRGRVHRVLGYKVCWRSGQRKLEYLYNAKCLTGDNKKELKKDANRKEVHRQVLSTFCSRNMPMGTDVSLAQLRYMPWKDHAYQYTVSRLKRYSSPRNYCLVMYAYSESLWLLLQHVRSN